MARNQTAGDLSMAVTGRSCSGSALRRTLRSQVSGVALRSAIGIAAAGVSLLAPGAARADCVVGGDVVQCVSTSTTNTTYPFSQPGDRYYLGTSLNLLELTVQTGAMIDGHGLAISNNAIGGVEVTNDGAIVVDAGNAPTAGGTAALTIQAAGGPLIYTGAGSITNNGDGNAFDARQTGGVGSIDLTISGSVFSATGEGVVVRDVSTSTGVSVTAGDVTALTVGMDGIDVQTQSLTGDVTIVANGDIQAGNAGIVAAIFPPLGTGNVNVTANGSIDARFGIDAENFGAGSTTVTSVGTVNATTGNGVFARAAGGTVTVNAGDVNATGNTAIIAEQTSAVGAGAIYVTAGDVSGTTGIKATNSGAGGVNVAATGAVTGTIGEGLKVTGKDWVSIQVADTMTGATQGLSLIGGTGGAGDIRVTGPGGFVGGTGDAANIQNDGSGSVTVDISGASRSAGGSGIVVTDTALGGDISVTTGDVTALSDFMSGIYVKAETSTGNVSIVANGDIQAGSSGILGIINPSTGTGDVAITANGAINGWIGVNAENRGAGSTSVTTVGPVNSLSGFGVFAATNGGAVRVDAGDVTSISNTGIWAQQGSSAGAGTIDVTAGNVSGATGLVATNLGTGAVSIIANGTVTGTVDDGLDAHGRDAVSIQVADTVTGAARGLWLTGGFNGAGDISVTGAGGFVGGTGDAANILNSGSGTVTVDISGASRSTDGSGIVVTDTALGGDISVTTGDVTALAAGMDGVSVQTLSATADVTIVANGDIQAGDEGLVAGIFAPAATGNIDITANGAVAAQYGIGALNLGAGSATVTALGPITTVDGYGVFAVTNGGDVTLSAGDVAAAGAEGIVALQISATGAGAVNVTTTGAVSGVNGVLAINNGSGAINVIANGTVDAEGIGIDAENVGSGATTVTAAGPVTAGGLGVFATTNGGDVTVNADDVSSTGDAGIVAMQGQGAGTGTVTVNAGDVSGATGIAAVNLGSGQTHVTTAGTVVGTLDFGIAAYADVLGGDLVIDAMNVTGADTGIVVDNYGVGSADVTVRGRVHGATSGVDVFSDASQAVTVQNLGVIQNSSGQSSDLAITAIGGAVDVRNVGSLVGTLNLDATSSQTQNLGSWNSIGGTNIFLGADDRLLNIGSGVIVGSGLAGVAETTIWAGLEVFSNAGLIQLQDGGTGDSVQTSADTQFLAGSVLSVDAGGLNTDLFLTTGTVDILPGSQLIVNTTQPLVLGQHYVVVQADGGLTGQFDYADTLVTAFAGLRDGYTDTTAYVEFGQIRALAEAGTTPNQKAAAAGADSLASGNAVKDALLMLPDDAAAMAAFDQLSGEIHPSARTAAVEDSRLPRQAILNRLSDDQSNGAVWGQVYGGWGRSDGDVNAARLDRDSRGLMFGADASVSGHVTLGVAAGWTNTDLDLKRRASHGTVESLHGLVYLGADLGGWSLKAGAGYAGTSTDTERAIVFPGFSGAPTASYDGSVTQGFVEAGYRIPLAKGGHAEPFANVTMVRAKTDAFSETTGPAALSGEAASEDATLTNLGVRFETNGVGAFVLKGSTGWRHSTGDLDPVGRHAFAGGSTFTVLGAAQSNDAAFVNLEARWALTPSATFGVGYDGVLGTDGQDHAVTGGLKIIF